jgi:hypothetical protein
MRVIHLERMSGTGRVVPRCGVWGSTDTDWTGVASGVTCVACRGAMGGAPDGPSGEEASTRASATARGGRTPAGSSFAVRYVGAALVAWVGAWSLLAVSGVLPAAGSRATTVALWITVVILVLAGAAFAALAGTELALGMHRDRGQVRGHPTR